MAVCTVTPSEDEKDSQNREEIHLSEDEKDSQNREEIHHSLLKPFSGFQQYCLHRHSSTTHRVYR